MAHAEPATNEAEAVLRCVANLISRTARAVLFYMQVRTPLSATAKAGDRAHDRDAIGALDKFLHERAVDLDLVERKNCGDSFDDLLAATITCPTKHARWHRTQPGSRRYKSGGSGTPMRRI
jgi:hypothetical protein